MKLDLTDNEAQVVMDALGEMPAKITIGVILKINNQIAAQREQAMAEQRPAPGPRNGPIGPVPKE